MESAYKMGRSQGKRILFVGGGGTGKTTQELTLPRPLLHIGFDPSSTEPFSAHPEAIYGPEDVMYEMFPFGEEYLTKPPLDSLPYNRFRKWWDENAKKGTFDRFASFALDSLTTYSDAAMEPVLHANGRWGKFPHQDDYGPQMTNIMDGLRPLISYARRGKVFLLTAHDELRDNERGTMVYQIMTTGKMREKLPLLFGERYRAEVLEEKDPKTGRSESRYVLRTRPTGLYPGIRSSLPLDNPHDVTIGDFSHPGDYGLGKILREKWGASGDVPLKPSEAGPKPVVGVA